MYKLLSCIFLGLLLTLTTLPQAAAQQATPTPVYERYTVQEGDTLGGIAFRYGTTAMAILRANNLTDLNMIITGTDLLIPIAPPTPTPIPSPQPLVPIPSIGFELGGEIVSFAHLDALGDAGMGWARLRLVWNAGDSTAGAERIINRLHNAGYKVLLDISGAPSEANLTLYYANFVGFVGDVAKLAPDAIEIWSGMNNARLWAHGLNDATVYADLLRSAYTAVKRANPAVLVLTGALAPSDDNTGYLSVLAGAGAGQYTDCIGMGYTLGALPPAATSGDPRGEAFYYYFPTVIGTYAQFFPDKPLCFTEVGYLVPGETAVPDSFAWAKGTTPELRAEWLAQAATIAQRLGRVRAFMVYNVDAEISTVENPAKHYAIRAADGTCLACESLSGVMR